MPQKVKHGGYYGGEGSEVEWKVARDCIYCRVEVQKHIDAKILIVNIIHPVLSVAFIRARLG